ncbi:MAG: tRNA preQ1(34) S-adenosylmethionine ribosyltransferase-isomerase QueA [Anaerolineae bacterium]|nr:tRNA preQ1(34) S-adenosylmethionine ribosyltransferase-isomerase QueA [Anaerolineae bacterium]
MRTSDFDYQLPPELIAQTPIEPRDASRLMVVDRARESLTHHYFQHLSQFLRAGDLLVHNRTRVIPARLYAHKPTGGRAEILLLRPRSETVWEALVRGRGVRRGMCLDVSGGAEGDQVLARAEVLAEGERGLRVLSFDRSALLLAEQVGQTPLPPYIHEPLRDPGRYQTVYAQVPGSAAAPTAGLHFTPDLLRQLQEAGVQCAFVTLHIGLDTFQPVRVECPSDHRMHTEYCSLPPDAAEQVNQAKLEGRRVIAVGTTSVRVLETAALQATAEDRDGQACLGQVVVPFEGDTNLFIYPGFSFRVVDALITNFHLPRSTLLMLVAAFCSKRLMDAAYAEAVRQRYRFYSFGDAMLIA